MNAFVTIETKRKIFDILENCLATDFFVLSKNVDDYNRESSVNGEQVSLRAWPSL